MILHFFLLIDLSAVSEITEPWDTDNQSLESLSFKIESNKSWLESSSSLISFSTSSFMSKLWSRNRIELVSCYIERLELWISYDQSTYIPIMLDSLLTHIIHSAKLLTLRYTYIKY